jgi:hypothetical protein
MDYIMKKSSLKLILLIGLIIMNVGIKTHPQHQMVPCKNPMCDIMVKARGYQSYYLKLYVIYYMKGLEMNPHIFQTIYVIICLVL